MTSNISYSGKKSTIKLEISLRNWWTALVVLLFLKPALAEDIEILDFFFNAGRFGLSIVYIAKMLFVKKKMSKDWLLLFTIFICVFLTTIIYKGFISKALTHYVPALGLLAYVYGNKDRIPKLLVIIYKSGIVLLVINFISVILFPDGIVFRVSDSLRVWILGQKQDLGGFVIPFLFIVLILKKMRNEEKDYSFWFAYVICIATCLVEKSLGAVIALGILGLLILSDKYIIRLNKTFLIIALILAFVVIQYISFNFNNMTLLQNYMSNIVTYGVSKSRTLNVRFSMWQFAWDTLKQYPLFGVGKLTPERWYFMSGLVYHSMMDNMYIDILFTGGIVSFVLFVWLIVRSFNSLRKYWNDRGVRQLGYCLFALCVLFFGGCPYLPFVYLLLTLPAWINDAGIATYSISKSEEVR